ncbi:S1 RNA-binding domain-containing protein [Kitasatospora sp. NPDC002227]|uniref:S1 RNA-binding domain-containing protein n=1 Tax=Kitasatospora sp. NPDC002227 TaxID=3154773 RepID=UPI00331B0D4F
MTSPNAPTDPAGFFNATAHPELWAFLSSLRPGRLLTGTVAAIERFGVFVRLDEGPDHPVFPGVGFLTYPELSWRPFDSVTDVVEVGQRVTCEFLQFDDWNGEARLSLRATRPDPFRPFADTTAVGDRIPVRITTVLPIGAVAEAAPSVHGLIPAEELSRPVAPGDEITVTVTLLDRGRRRLLLSERSPGVARWPDAPS